MKKIIHAVRICRLFEPMTLKEAKALCLSLTEPMIRENKRTSKFRDAPARPAHHGT